MTKENPGKDVLSSVVVDGQRMANSIS